MELTKNMRAGYQGKPDAMRKMADRLLDHPGFAQDVYPSKSAVENEKMRPYKKGGSVKKREDTSSLPSRKNKDGCAKFAMGGVAKIRHGEATNQGLPKEFKKKSLKDVL